MHQTPALRTKRGLLFGVAFAEPQAVDHLRHTSATVDDLAATTSEGKILTMPV